MIITTTQKLIKIGSSRGVTIPAKQLKALGVEPGDDLELVIRKKTATASTETAVKTANALLDRYRNDFHNLANR